MGRDGGCRELPLHTYALLLPLPLPCPSPRPVLSCLQGNADMYTAEMLQKRHRVRVDPRLEENIKAWWRVGGWGGGPYT